MKYLSILLFIFAISSCTNTAENKADTNDSATIAEQTLAAAGEVSTQAIDSLCFLSLKDAKRKDSFYVKLLIKGDDVTGSMAYAYYQKDSRRGALTGTKKGKRISAMWYYMQEGMKDSLRVHFKLKDNELYQMAPGYDADQDQDDLPYDKQYAQIYQQVDCK